MQSPATPAPAAIPRAGPAPALHAMYQANQRMIVGYLKRTRGMVGDVRALTQSSRHRLLYPLRAPLQVLTLDAAGAAANPALAASAVPEDALPKMLATKLSDVETHLDTLEARVMDPTCRVLVGGDLNAGKSTFVNALLRRDVVPVDQQPLTNVFVEVLDARHNQLHPGVEEVHAHKEVGSVIGALVAPGDEAPVARVHPLEDLFDLVEDPDDCELVKVYCNEEQAERSSVLVGNEHVDVRVIDSPGLNRDMWQTMALFAQQKEIDVIVFLVSAENQITLSAREFLTQAGQEKAYIFIVINKFDAIKDKERCKKIILQQIEELSPHTYRYKEKLVHFVSAERMMRDVTAIRTLAEQGQLADDEEEMMTPAMTEFVRVEEALKEFVLEKRSVAKLSPAKRYMQRLLHDLELVLGTNVDAAASHLHLLQSELAQVQPREMELAEERQLVLGSMNKAVTDAADNAAAHVHTQFGKLSERLLERGQAVAWRGIRHAPAYVRDLHAVLTDQLEHELAACQEHARVESKLAWEVMAKTYAEWAREAIAAAATDAAAAAKVAPKLAPLATPAVPLSKLYPVSLSLSPQALLLPRFLLVAPSESSSSIRALVPASVADVRVAYEAAVQWLASLTWTDVTHAPAAALSALSGTHSLASVAVTGCSLITSSALSRHGSIHADVLHVGMRVGLRRMAALAIVGTVVVGAVAGYHYVATLPAHLPATLARAAVARLAEANVPTHVAGEVRAATAVALTQALGDAAAKMEVDLGRVRDRHRALTEAVEEAEEVVAELDTARERARLLADQVEAVALDESLTSLPALVQA
ncbi:mitofusin [Allomyces arbusculus]|nr:mitofusin [Allomyces arbusculus]